VQSTCGTADSTPGEIFQAWLLDDAAVRQMSYPGFSQVAGWCGRTIWLGATVRLYLARLLARWLVSMEKTMIRCLMLNFWIRSQSYVQSSMRTMRSLASLVLTQTGNNWSSNLSCSRMTVSYMYMYIIDYHPFSIPCFWQLLIHAGVHLAQWYLWNPFSHYLLYSSCSIPQNCIFGSHFR
jgi:hypothetical protein